jgi:5-oxopent-3-ene-1,2,5-tricarboxylate decarboxylase / 2-hydroxyhepta-2,4-diene-1,7-dioate isomerase
MDSHSRRIWCSRVTEFRRIEVEGKALEVERQGDSLVAKDGRNFAIQDAHHLPPAIPTKIIAVHLNYDSRTKEFLTKLPAAPTYFHKPITALNSHQGNVVRPKRCKWLNYEGEIVIIIGKTCKDVSIEEAGGYIAGYSVGNDFGLHDFRDTDAGSMLRVKGADSLAPVGPGIVTDWDFRNKMIRTYVNGELKQEDNTDNMEWNMHYLVADIARTITLVPGDMIFSGTPAHSRPVQIGDIVEVEVEGLGRLSNTITEGHMIREGVGAQPTESEEVISTALGGDWEFRGIRTPSKDLYPSTVKEKE